MRNLREQVKAALVIEHWKSGRRSTDDIARELAIDEDEVCRILENEQIKGRGRS